MLIAIQRATYAIQMYYMLKKTLGVYLLAE